MIAVDGCGFPILRVRLRCLGLFHGGAGFCVVSFALHLCVRFVVCIGYVLVVWCLDWCTVWPMVTFVWGSFTCCFVWVLELCFCGVGFAFRCSRFYSLGCV